MKRKALLRKWFPLLTLVLAFLALAFLALACEEEEEEEATPTPMAETPTVTETPAALTPTPTALGPGAAGIPSNPREVRGLEGIITLDDGLAIWKERPADEDRTGVTADSIKIGRHGALSGPFASMVALERLAGPVLEAVFERVNEAGGIHGRKIELITRDDQYSVAVSVQVTQQLIEEDKVFALLLAMGGPPHTATHAMKDAVGLPDVWVFASEQREVEDLSRGYPVTNRTDIPFAGSNLLRGFLSADVFWRLNPDAKVAVLYSNDSLGDSLLEGARIAAQLRGKELVAEIAYDVGQPDLTAQAYQVAESGADAVANFAITGATESFTKALRETVGSDIPMSTFGWYPPANSQLFDGTFSPGVQASIYTMPDLPVWAKLDALAAEEGFANVPSISSIALTAAEFMIRALELAGPDPTREGLIEAFETGFDGSWSCSTCYGPPIMGPQDHWALESVLLGQWSHAEQRYCSINRQPGEPCWPTGNALDEVESYETSLGQGARGNWPGWDCAPPSAEFPEGTCPWKQGG